MLEQRAIAIPCLLVWAGIGLGLLLLVAQDVVGYGSSCWGIASLLLSCAYSCHRSVSAREDRLREAFDLGREHERGQRSLHSLR